MSRVIQRPWFSYLAVIAAVLLAVSIEGQRVGWQNLLLTPDQRGQLSMDRGRPSEAANAFRDPLWRGVALFRAGDFKSAAQVFAGLDTAEGAYDQGNALVMLGQYDEAVKGYDRALRLHPGWDDATANRELARIRAERVRQEGGQIDDTESEPDEIVFDKAKKGGEDTTVEGDRKPLSDQAIRAMWLKRVQTKPADFLKIKFAYQLQTTSDPALGQEAKP